MGIKREAEVYQEFKSFYSKDAHMEWALGDYVEVNGDLAVIIGTGDNCVRIVHVLGCLAETETVPVSELRKPESRASKELMFETMAVSLDLTPEEYAAQKRMRELL